MVWHKGTRYPCVPMYAPFFGLDQSPFSIAPDPRYLFMSERHREALAHLLYGLDAGGGFVLLTGGIGTGKTTVCRCFLEQVPQHCNIAYILNPKLDVPELLRSICEEFGIPVRAGGVKDWIDRLNQFLLHQHAAGRNNALIIDEAQNLAPDVLEQLRLLTNLETSERKLLQIILIGQPELRTLIARPQMEQLAQRVIARYHLGSLKSEEIRHYVAHRLTVAGWRGPLPFSRGALNRIYPLSGGIPRRINLLCDRALLGAYAAGLREVTENTIRKAAREVFDSGVTALLPVTSRATVLWGIAGGVLLGAVVVVAIAMFLFSRNFEQGMRERYYRWLSVQTAPQQVEEEALAATGTTEKDNDSRPISETQSPLATLPDAAAALTAFLAQQSTESAALWQALALLWQAPLHGVLPSNVPPCVALNVYGLRCWQHDSATVQMLRQLDRPALLTLQPSKGAAPVTVLLRQWKEAVEPHVTLQGSNGSTLQLPVTRLQSVWNGAMTTLWQMPPGMEEHDDDAAARQSTAMWLDRHLSRARITPAESLRARIVQFQKLHQLTPDGLAGPQTLMLLNRASGVPEPVLSVEQ